MALNMSQKTKKEYLEKMRWRYGQRSGKMGKTVLIDEFCEMTGHERKYAIKLLASNRCAPDAKKRKKGRKPTYGPDLALVLKEIWLLGEQPCGKRLAPVLPIWLKSYEKRHGPLAQELSKKLIKISASQIDRVLAPIKVTHPGRGTRRPKANTALKAVTPIRAKAWDVKEPGWLETDTVAHCGGSMHGSFLWSLDNVDVFSGWTEVGSVWNCGQHAVCKRFQEIEGRLPFALKGVDTDNGGEFLNWHFHGYFQGREPAVELTRCRPYHKNDQAHVEQKNYTHVRLLLGYERLDYSELVDPVNELLRVWSEWRNLYCATMKQLSSHREGGKLIRRHEKRPQTPCQRLIDYWQSQGQASKAQELETLRAGRDPIEMKEEIEGRLKKIDQLHRALQADSPSPVSSSLRSDETGDGEEKTPKNNKNRKPASVSSIMSQPAAA
jgi:hypothetical protein